MALDLILKDLYVRFIAIFRSLSPNSKKTDTDGSYSQTEDKNNSMDPKVLIEKALTAGRAALNEKESKELLARFGIPVLQEAVVENEDDETCEPENIQET